MRRRAGQARRSPGTLVSLPTILRPLSSLAHAAPATPPWSPSPCWGVRCRPCRPTRAGSWTQSLGSRTSLLGCVSLLLSNHAQLNSRGAAGCGRAEAEGARAVQGSRSLSGGRRCRSGRRWASISNWRWCALFSRNTIWRLTPVLSELALTNADLGGVSRPQPELAPIVTRRCADDDDEADPETRNLILTQFEKALSLRVCPPAPRADSVLPRSHT